MPSEQMESVEDRLNQIQAILPSLGEQLLELQTGDLGVLTKSNTFDLLTKADTASEAQLVAFIQENFADDVILAEEGSVASDAQEAGERFLWILDPIDGTTNYANGLPVWAISIGLMQDSEMVGGIVCAPGMGLCYRAVAGAGATCNDRSISVNKKASMSEGIIATGFPYDRAKRAEPICRALENMLRQAGGIRRLGAASLDFCFLADGRYAGYYEIGLKPWDFAAGSLIAREAGAKVTDLSGKSLDIFNSAGVVATNSMIHGELMQAAQPMIRAAEL
ncbi:inositol monophosphatase [Coraliomargarita sinensis]|uniref:Inositol-1-monophosphatase n=1 Tax=Coraliomargarita sinensis TaxID=2174842 RepID=A0A317ZJ33_9BACT|nr:inositol monophosphatase family protein [Coraliomargarita sinensis]PXA05635.1 inositol monophosphatase [Coraliomargarita sinensis]